MKNNIIILAFLVFITLGCVGTSSQGIFGTGVSVALDPRSIGTQIDDNIMQKSLVGRLVVEDKNYLLSINTKVLDGRIFIMGKVDDPEEKLKITKMAWETKGVRSVKNDIIVKDEFNFQQSAKDLLITSQLRAALIINKAIKSSSTINHFKLNKNDFSINEISVNEIVKIAKKLL